MGVFKYYTLNLRVCRCWQVEWWCLLTVCVVCVTGCVVKNCLSLFTRTAVMYVN